MKALALKLLGALLFLTAVAMWLSRAPDWPVEALVARWAPPPSDFIDVKGQLVHLRDVGPRRRVSRVPHHSLHTCCAHYPAAATGALRSLRQ